MATSKKGSKKGAAKTSSRIKGSPSAEALPTSGSVPPYGEAIRQAAARGDQAEMRKTAASARKWIKDAQTALDKLEKKLGGTK